MLAYCSGSSGATPNPQDSTHVTPLHLACSLGHAGVVSALQDCPGLHYGMITGYGATALHMAVRGGHGVIVERLLARCDDAAFVDAVDYRRHSALHMAAGLGLVDAVTLLVAHGADVNLTDAEMLTPLHKAIESARVGTVQALLEAGCDVNQHTVPPLVYAIVSHDSATRDGKESGEYIRIVKLLLVAGADPCILNAQGVAALTLAWVSEMKQPMQNALQLLRTVLHYGNVVRHIEAKRDSITVFNFIRDMSALYEEKRPCGEQVLNVLGMLREAGVCEGRELLTAYRSVRSAEVSLDTPLAMDLRALCRLCIRKRVGHETLRELAVPTSIRQFLSYDCNI
jgi:ankyrin repeat protein